MLKKLYLSPLGIVISVILNFFKKFTTPFMVYGYFDKVSGQFRKHTRIGSNVYLGSRDKIAMEDHVWIWHHSVIDGSNGVTIGEGVQIGAWCGIFTHGSHIAIRLFGRDFIRQGREDRKGYTRGAVSIGDYTFIGTGALLLPGTKIGRGCIITPNAVVSSEIPDFAIAKGDPAKVVGDVREYDKRFISDDYIRSVYFDPALAEEMRLAVMERRRNKV